jgi:hypothetical protein
VQSSGAREEGETGNAVAGARVCFVIGARGDSGGNCGGGGLIGTGTGYSIFFVRLVAERDCRCSRRCDSAR